MKKVSSVIFYYLTEFHCLVVFTSEDNEQYMCCNCLIPRMRCNKFEIKHIFLIKPFLCMTKSQGKYINISRRKKTFKVKKIMFFIIIKGCVRPESPVLRWVTRTNDFDIKQHFFVGTLSEMWVAPIECTCLYIYKLPAYFFLKNL